MFIERETKITFLTQSTQSLFISKQTINLFTNELVFCRCVIKFILASYSIIRPPLPWLTAWSKVLLEKLTVPQPVTEFSAFYGNRTFIVAQTTASHLSVS